MIPMTRKEWMKENLPVWVADCYAGGVCGCPNTYPLLKEIDPTTEKDCVACWNKEIPNIGKENKMNTEFPNTIKPVYKTEAAPTYKENGVAPGVLIDDDLTYRYPSEEKPHILDSGNRREFESGAVRDMAEGKGDMVSIPWEALLRLSVHYENGAKKYDRWNFRKGIPVSSFIDSACRHLAKYQCGCDDEDHLAAAAFNVLGAMLMENTKPEMQDLPLREGKNTFDYFK